MKKPIIINRPKGWRRLRHGEVIKNGDWCIDFMRNDWKDGWSARSIGFRVNRQYGCTMHFRKYETSTFFEKQKGQ